MLNCEATLVEYFCCLVSNIVINSTCISRAYQLNMVSSIHASFEVQIIEAFSICKLVEVLTESDASAIRSMCYDTSSGA